MASLKESPCGADDRVCSIECRMHHLAVVKGDRGTQSDFLLNGRSCERRHGPACYPQRRARDRPWKYRQPGYSVDDAWLGGHRCRKIVGMLGRDERVPHLKVATGRATKPSDTPTIMNHHLLAREV